eukprot:5140801-Alexandrium_andersonii.AAC.1
MSLRDRGEKGPGRGPVAVGTRARRRQSCQGGPVGGIRGEASAEEAEDMGPLRPGRRSFQQGPGFLPLREPPARGGSPA